MDSPNLVKFLKRLNSTSISAAQPFEDLLLIAKDRWPPILSVAIFLLVLASISVCKACKRSHTSKLSSFSDNDGLKAFWSVCTSTSLAQPSDLRHYLELTRVRKPRHLQILLGRLVDSILVGDLELRDPDEVLHFIKGHSRIYGWTVELITDSLWSIAVLKWIICAYLSPKRVYALNSPRSLCLISEAIPDPCRQPLDFDLDFVDYVNLSAEIDRIKSLELQTGSQVIVELSCLAAHVGFGSKNFMLCAVPFLHRTSRVLPNQRTPTALLVRASDVMSRFSTGALHMTSFTNISDEHASCLRSQEIKLTDDPFTRRQCIKKAGEIAWREERLLLVLEAGLLESGLLTRWRLVLSKQYGSNVSTDAIGS